MEAPSGEFKGILTNTGGGSELRQRMQKYVPYHYLTEDEALQLSRVLGAQESRYGFNMFQVITPQDQPEIQMMMRSGKRYEDSVYALFERKYNLGGTPQVQASASAAGVGGQPMPPQMMGQVPPQYGAAMPPQQPYGYPPQQAGYGQPLPPQQQQQQQYPPAQPYSTQQFPPAQQYPSQYNAQQQNVAPAPAAVAAPTSAPAAPTLVSIFYVNIFL